MKLISMTDFVLKQNKILNKYINYDKGCLFEIIIYYANFLKQPLELWMFVPCDEDGNVLELSKHLFAGIESINYQQAKERCLFEGFNFLEKNEKLFHVENKKEVFGVGYKNGIFKTIEDLVKYDIELTKTAEKLIGL